MLAPSKKNSTLLIIRSVLQKMILIYYILNFINKIFLKIYFLSCYISTYIIRLILFLAHNPKQLKDSTERLPISVIWYY